MPRTLKSFRLEPATIAVLDALAIALDLSQQEIVDQCVAAYPSTLKLTAK